MFLVDYIDSFSLNILNLTILKKLKIINIDPLQKKNIISNSADFNDFNLLNLPLATSLSVRMTSVVSFGIITFP